MRMTVSNILKLTALAGIAVAIAGCKMQHEADMEDTYQPVAHYERHPIIVTKTGAHAKDCGRWPKDLTRTQDNEIYSNFGCAQQKNIAAMVANPNDLVKPRASTPSDPMRRSKVFDDYRKGQATAAQEEKQQQILISDVVKDN